MYCNFLQNGSTISRDGEVCSDVVARLAKASKAFGCLRAAVFQNKQVSVDVKHEWQYYPHYCMELKHGYSEGGECEEAEKLSQLRHQGHAWSVQVTTVGREDHL